MSLAIGLFIGLALGLTGGGGAVLAIPLLVLVLGLPMDLAVPVSLVITALTAFIGSLDAFKNKLIFVKPLLLFGLGAALSTPVGLQIGHFVPEYYRMIGFALLTLGIALHIVISLVKNTQQFAINEVADGELKLPVCRFSSDHSQFKLLSVCSVLLVLSGLLTGLLSGFFGVGGGFLIVPALMFLTQMSIAYAIGNSLAIISIIGISSVIFSFQELIIHQATWLPILLASIVGLIIGRIVVRRTSMRRLKVVLSITLVISSVLTLLRVLTA